MVDGYMNLFIIYFFLFIIISLQKYRHMSSSVSILPNLNETITNQVNIYLRNYKKMAILVSIPSPVICNELSQYIANKFGTDSSKLALFFNGQRIDLSPKDIILLKDKSIIHVVQLDRTKRQDLNILFKYPNHQGQVLKVKTTPKAQIKSVFQSFIIPYFGKSDKQVFFAYLGKPINIFRTFEEELIEDQCQLMILQFKKIEKKQHQVVNYSHHVLNKSIDTTQNHGMPVMIARGKQDWDTQKQKNAQKNKNKPYQQESTKNKAYQQQSIKVEVAPHQQKLQSLISQNDSSSKIKQLQEIAAPHEQDPNLIEENAAPGVYKGFDPHQYDAAAPKVKNSEEKLEKSSKPIKFDPKLSLESNPEHECIQIKEKDLLYMGYNHMPETQNFTAGVVQQYKQNFLKKKSSSSKQNKK